MQVTLPPSPVWWELERWRRGGARAGAPRDEPGAEQVERGTEGAEGAPRTLSEKLAQFRLLEMQRLRDLHALIERQRLTIPDILQLYTPSRLGQADGARPTSTWRQRPLSATWHHIDINPHRHVEPNRGPERVWGEGAGASVGMGAGAGAGSGAGAGGWGAAGGWGVGMVLLVAALALMRLADRCLARKYLRSRRRRSQEWPAPHVLATGQRPNAVDLAVQPHILDAFHSDSSESSGEPFAADPPPPYSERKPTREEPPPPYSADYVAYSPKDGQPSVRFFSGQRQIFVDADASHSSDSIGGSAEIAHSLNGFNHIDSGHASDEISIDMPDNTDGDSPVGEAIGHGSAVRMAPIATEIMSIDSSDDNATTSDDPNN